MSGVTVQTADGVTATVKTDKDSKVAVTAADVTLKGLDFVSEDGTAVISGGACDGLTLDNCSFENKKDDLKDTIALYIHQPSITVQNCDFTNWERGYYTCGDNSAAGAITFEGNTFTNVRVPFDGYWGKPATEETDIQITGNTFDSGDWDAALYPAVGLCPVSVLAGRRKFQAEPRGEVGPEGHDQRQYI